MNTKEFFDKINKMVGPGRRDIVEKDFHLHRLLHEISNDEYLNENLVFKGGSCLVKAYTGYYRFSEDIDLTWKDREEWKELSSNQTRKRCSEEIDVLINKFDQIAKKLGLDFKAEKSNRRYVSIGGGGRMPTFFVRYHSKMIDMPSMIKVEINFVDKTIYPFKERELNSFVEGFESEEISFLFEECWNNYTKPVSMDCYSPQEIYTDKARALLTRMVYKMRDSIDLYVLRDRYGYNIEDHKEEIIEKTRFMLELYEKYRENLQKDIPVYEEIAGEESKLLIKSFSDDIENDISLIHGNIKKVRENLDEND